MSAPPAASPAFWIQVPSPSPSSSNKTPVLQPGSLKRAASSTELSSLSSARSSVVPDSASDTEGAQCASAMQPVAKKPRKGDPDLVYCHQDHQAHKKSDVLSCTSVRISASSSKEQKCGRSYCARCLNTRYAEDAKSVIDAGGQDEWECPACRGICNCSTCRRKSNQPATGSLAKLAKSQGLASAADVLMKDPTATVIPKKVAVGSTSAKAAQGPFSLSNSALKPSLTAPNAPYVGPSGTQAKKSTAKKTVPGATDGNESSDLSDIVSDVSSLSSLSSDEDDNAPSDLSATTAATNNSKSTKTKTPAPQAVKSKTKRAAAAPPPPKPAPVAAKPRGKPAPRLVAPPPTTRLLVPPYVPSSSILAKLHLREFFIRFHSTMPSLSVAPGSSNARTAHVIIAALEDLERFWGPGADVNQRGVLEGVLELLAADEEAEGGQAVEEVEGMEWIAEALGEVAAAKKSASVEAANRPWETVWTGLKEGKEGGWDAMEEEWRSAREAAEERGDAKRRTAKWEVGLEKRLASMCALVDMALDTSLIRTEMVEGIDTERVTRIELNKQNARRRADLLEAKQKLNATKPEEPTASPSKKVAVKAKWRDAVAKVAKEVKQLEKDSEGNLRRINHEIHLTSVVNRIRFSSAGTDSASNTYYFLAPVPETPYPTDTPTPLLPLSWSVLIHGHLFPPPKKDDDPLARAEGDDWFVVADPTDLSVLADFVEYAPKKTKYERDVAEEKAKEKRESSKAKGKGKAKAVEEEGEGDEVADVSELVAALRGFADFVQWERASAFEGAAAGRGRELRGRELRGRRAI